VLAKGKVCKIFLVCSLHFPIAFVFCVLVTRITSLLRHTFQRQAAHTMHISYQQKQAFVYSTRYCFLLHYKFTVYKTITLYSILWRPVSAVCIVMRLQPKHPKYFGTLAGRVKKLTTSRKRPDTLCPLSTCSHPFSTENKNGWSLTSSPVRFHGVRKECFILISPLSFNGVMDSYFEKVQTLQKPKHKVLTQTLKPETNQVKCGTLHK